MSANAVNGQPLSFTVNGGVMVNGANVTLADVNTSNGVIHVIDKVLTPTDTPNDIPRTAECTGVHNSLVAGVIQAELLPTLQGNGPFTVFAPTDQALARQLNTNTHNDIQYIKHHINNITITIATYMLKASSTR